MSQYFNQFEHLVRESTPQLTVAEQFALDMAATQLAMSGLLAPASTPYIVEPTPEQPTIEETSEEDENSQQANQRSNPKAVGRSTVKRKSSTQTRR